MFKKLAVAGVALVIGAVVLCWVVPELGDLARKWLNNGKEAISNATSLEDKITDLRKKVADLDSKKQTLVDNYGVKASAEKEAEKDVAKAQAARDQEMARVDAFTRDLSDTKLTSFNYQDDTSGKNKTFTREEVQAQLEKEFRNLKNADTILESKKELLEARQAAKDATWEAVTSFNQQRDKLNADLDEMEAKLTKVRAHEAAAAEKVSDNDVAAIAAQIGDLNKKVDEKDNAADAAQALKGGPINPVPNPTADSKDDILKQIRDYKEAKAAPKAAPAPVIADQK
jgi:chromosome segregation ATPase